MNCYKRRRVLRCDCRRKHAIASLQESKSVSRLFHLLREGEFGGRCGRCEYRKLCRGCRARAFADTGDFLGPDEACAYEPDGHRAAVEAGRDVVFGMPAPQTLVWTPQARQRLERVPSFVRAVVTARVEAFAKDQGYREVTVEVMQEVQRNVPGGHRNMVRALFGKD